MQTEHTVAALAPTQSQQRTAMPSLARLRMHAPGAAAQAVEDALEYARQALLLLSLPLEQVFATRDQVRARGAERLLQFWGISANAIHDVEALDQAEAIALLTCYGRRIPPPQSGLRLG